MGGGSFLWKIKSHSGSATSMCEQNEKMCKKLRCQNKAGKMKRGAARGDARVKVEKKCMYEVKEGEILGTGKKLKKGWGQEGKTEKKGEVPEEEKTEK